MSDYGTRAKESVEKQVELRLKHTYTEAQKDILKKLDQFTAKFTQKDKAKREQVKNGTITEEEYQRWLAGQVFMGAQWEEKVRDITDTLTDIRRDNLKMIHDRQIDVFTSNANYQAYRIDQDIGKDFGFDIYDRDAVERLIREKPALLPEKIVDPKKHNSWNQGIIANSVTQGIIQGESIPKIAARIANTTANHNMKASTLYARTAMTCAQNSGRMQMLHECKDMGIDVKKKWLAASDARVRDSHRHLNGQVAAVEKPFKSDYGNIDFPGDPKAHPCDVYNCRCTLVYVFPEYEDYSKDDLGQFQNLTEEEKKMGVNEFFAHKYQKAKERTHFNNLERIQQQRKELDSNEDKIESMINYSKLDKDSVKNAAEALFGYGSDPEHCFFDGADTEIRSRTTAEASKRADAIQKYIDASPKAEGTIYRGMAVPKEKLDLLTIGTEFDERQYSISSWSSSENAGQRFASNSVNRYGGERVVFEYKNPKHGTPVAHLSPTPIEQEVLVNNKKVKYRIVSKEEYVKSSNTLGNRKFTRIILEEIEE